MILISRQYFRNDSEGEVDNPEIADFMVEKVLLGKLEMQQRYPELFEDMGKEAK